MVQGFLFKCAHDFWLLLKQTASLSESNRTHFHDSGGCFVWNDRICFSFRKNTPSHQIAEIYFWSKASQILSYKCWLHALVQKKFSNFEKHLPNYRVIKSSLKHWPVNLHTYICQMDLFYISIFFFFFIFCFPEERWEKGCMQWASRICYPWFAVPAVILQIQKRAKREGTHLKIMKFLNHVETLPYDFSMWFVCQCVTNI